MAADFSKIGKRSKDRGKAYERLVAGSLTEYTGVNFRKTPASGGFNRQGIQVAGHIFCGDLMCDSPDFKFSVEAKNRKAFSFQHILSSLDNCDFTQWWFQTVRDARIHNLEPMLWFKPKPGSPDNFVVVTEADWGNKLPTRIIIPGYDRQLSFKIKERSDGEKKARMHDVVARMPIPAIVQWKYFKEAIDKSELFGTPSVKDYGELVSYS